MKILILMLHAGKRIHGKKEGGGNCARTHSIRNKQSSSVYNSQKLRDKFLKFNFSQNKCERIPVHLLVVVKSKAINFKKCRRQFYKVPGVL